MYTHTHTCTYTAPFIIEGLSNETVILNVSDTLRLTCVGENPPNATSQLFFVWLVNASPFSYTDPRITNTVIPPNHLRSTLNIDQTTIGDSGKYTCTVANRMPFRSANGASSSVDVHVLCELELNIKFS